jgi:hypothetical protein
VLRIGEGFVLLQAEMARGGARSMRQDDPARRHADLLPLGPGTIEARADALRARAAAYILLIEEPDRASFLGVLRTPSDMTWLAPEAAQATVPQLGARGYLAGAEAGRRLREAQFVAIATPSAKHITTELARGRRRPLQTLQANAQRPLYTAHSRGQPTINFS